MVMRGEIQRGDQVNCYCPVCQPTGDSRDRRLYYKYENGKLLAQCKHGCDFEKIAEFFPKTESGSAPWTVLREHVYYTESGAIFGKKVYYLVNGKKQPVWYRFESSEYKTGLEGQKAGLYNIIDLLEDKNGDVYITEGEKDAETLKAAGLLAVSPPNGAGYWRAAFNQYFRGRNVVIIPDNDEAGKKHLEKVARNLKKSAKTVRLIDLTDIVPDLKPGGDISDVFAELPDAKTELLRLISETESEETRSQAICFITNDDNKPLKTFENFKLMLAHYGIGIKYNSISGTEFIGHLPKMTG